MYGTQHASHIWQLDYVTLICGELERIRRGKHSAALFNNSNEDVRMAVHGDDFVWLSIAEPLFGVGTGQTGQCLDIELALRHAPLIINESGCNANTKTPERNYKTNWCYTEERVRV